jgi:hypothetical protein
LEMKKRKDNRLVSVYAKADFAVGMANQARDHVRHPGGLWYHAVGMMNAFFAITEELKTRTMNVPDQQLKEAVQVWRDANRSKVASFFGPARNTATHQGDIHVEPFTDWEEDAANDTSHPIKRTRVSVNGSAIKDMPEDEFLDRCKQALTFLRDGVHAIDKDYKARGGTMHALPEPAKLTPGIFKDIEL